MLARALAVPTSSRAFDDVCREHFAFVWRAARRLGVGDASLDDVVQEVFVTSALEQMPMPEIAEALGINVNTAYARLRIARQRFEEAVARHRARDGWRLR